MCYNCLLRVTEACYRGHWASKDEELPEVGRSRKKGRREQRYQWSLPTPQFYKRYALFRSPLPKLFNSIQVSTSSRKWDMYSQSWSHIHILMTVAEIVVERNIGSFFHIVSYLVSDTKKNNNTDTNKCKCHGNLSGSVEGHRPSLGGKKGFSVEVSC